MSTTLATKTTFMSSFLYLLLLLPTSISAACKVFQPLSNATKFTPYGVEAAPIPISTGVTCNSSAPCWVADPSAYYVPANLTKLSTPIGGYVFVNRTIARSTNADGTYSGVYTIDNSISASALDGLWNLIGSSTGMTFTPQISENNVGTGAAFELRQNMSAYVAFVPDQSCVQGYLRGCSGDDYFKQDTAIQACTPLSINGAITGHVALESVPNNQVSSVSCWACHLRALTSAGTSGKSVNPVLAGVVVSVLAVFLA